MVMGEKQKNVKETCTSTVKQIILPIQKKTPIFLKKEKKQQPTLKNQVMMLSELRGICFAQ